MSVKEQRGKSSQGMPEENPGGVKLSTRHHDFL